VKLSPTLFVYRVEGESFREPTSYKYRETRNFVRYVRAKDIADVVKLIEEAEKQDPFTEDHGYHKAEYVSFAVDEVRIKAIEMITEVELIPDSLLIRTKDNDDPQMKPAEKK
jgi:hypothetical protein